MSGSLPPGGPLSDAERVAARRFCGYPVYGPGASGFEGWRFFQAYGALEYRLTNMADEELAVSRRYLAELAKLEADILTSASKMGTDVAAVWTRNRREAQDRERLFDEWRERFCSFLGVPPGPEFSRRTAGAPPIVV